MTVQFNLQSRAAHTSLLSSLATRGFDESVASAGSFAAPPAGLPARSFANPERRPPVAIFGSPVVRADAAGLASRLGRTVRQTRLQQSGARIIRDTHPRLYRRGGQVCGMQIFSEPHARQEPASQPHRDRSNRLEAVRVVPFVFAAVLHAHNKSMEKQACRTQNLGSSNP